MHGDSRFCFEFVSCLLVIVWGRAVDLHAKAPEPVCLSLPSTGDAGAGAGQSYQGITTVVQ